MLSHTHLFRGLALLAATAACTPPPEEAPAAQEQAEPTDRLELPPSAVENLGITFAPATRGKLGVWRRVPGHLEVPEQHRWQLRAPAAGRLELVVARGTRVAAGDVVAELRATALPEAQRALLRARGDHARKSAEAAALRTRLAESELQLEQAHAFEQAARARVDELQALQTGGNPLSARELLAARQTATEAGQARLDAALARDRITALLATAGQEAEQATLAAEQQLQELAVLTGQPLDALRAGDAWRALDRLVVRAPAAGVVVELHAAQGETVAPGTPLVEVFDAAVLRFHGLVPEGDLGELRAGQRVRVELPARRVAAIETTLDPPLPVADPATRMVRVEAMVANDDGALAHGLSATAAVLVQESTSEEVLVPDACVVLDGLEAIVYRRDPDDPAVVVRTPVELGARARGQVEVLAGVLDGDALVRDGIHQLVRTGLGKPPAGGHVHADGTWHEGHD